MSLFHCKSNMFDSSVLFEETVGPKYWILSHNLAGGRKKKPSLLQQTIAIWFHVKTKQLWFPLLLRPILEILWKFELTQAAPLISHMKREQNDQRHGNFSTNVTSSELNRDLGKYLTNHLKERKICGTTKYRIIRYWLSFLNLQITYWISLREKDMRNYKISYH